MLLPAIAWLVVAICSPPMEWKSAESSVPPWRMRLYNIAVRASAAGMAYLLGLASGR